MIIFPAIFNILTTPEGAVKLKNKASKGSQSGQAAIEYLLITVSLVMFFSGMYGFLQGQVSRLFKAAGIVILTSYQ